MRQRGRIAAGAAVFAAVVFALAQPAFAQFGAVAYDTATGKQGYAFNHRTEKEAEAAALRECGAGCKVIFPVKPGQCAALAVVKKNKAVWGGATRGTPDGAKLAALLDCQKRTHGQCALRGGGCNRR